MADPDDLCPGCGSRLEHCIGWNMEQDYEGVRCPQGCNLEEFYA